MVNYKLKAMPQNPNLSTEFTTLKLKVEDAFADVVDKEKYEFPKYTTQIINIANQNSQGTRPPVVGQMSELIKECPEKSYTCWAEWYLAGHPDAIKNASDKIEDMIKKMENAFSKIDREMIERWVEDLVIVKTAEGLIIQESVFNKLSKQYNKEYTPSKPEDESKGIDGYIGNTALQVKSIEYLHENHLPEKITVPIIYYKKTNDNITIYIPNNLEIK
ncbi:MjaI family restriction endonuclease [Methanococcus sp. CF]